MLNSSGRYVCDKFYLGKVIPGTNQRDTSTEHVCGRPASWRRASQYGGFIHVCERRRRLAVSPTSQEFRPAPLSLPEKIIT